MRHYNLVELENALNRQREAARINLPDMDGRVVYERILALHPSMLVIFSTGHAGPLDLNREPQRPGTCLLMKPCDIDDLLAAIAGVSGRAQSP